MKMNGPNFREQVRRNAVALISLFIAVTGLLYNTWRNEHSELNRNHRWASFEILLLLSDLREIIYLNYYDSEQGDASDFRRGWSKVLLILDLADVLADPVPATAVELHGTWDDNWVALKAHDKDSLDEIEEAINRLRADTLMTLQDLD